MLVPVCGVLATVCGAQEKGIPGLREVKLGPDPRTFPGLSQPAFHERGWHFACVVEAEEGQRVYHDGVLLGPAYPEIDDLRLSPDGCHVAYAARRGDKWRVVVDGQLGPEYDDIARNGPSFHPDGTLEWLACRDGALWRVTVPPLP